MKKEKQYDADAVVEVDDDGWRIYRCPHCNAWDYAIQGQKGDVTPGRYNCGVCGSHFLVKED